MSKILPFMLCHSERDKNVIMAQALLLSNELAVPMHITKIVETKTDKGINYSVEVDDCLDEAEWYRLKRVYFYGYGYREHEIRKK